MALALSGQPIEADWLKNGINGAFVATVAGFLTCGVGLALLRVSALVKSAGFAVVAFVALNLIGAVQHDSAEQSQLDSLSDTLNTPGSLMALISEFGNSLIDLEVGLRVTTMNAPAPAGDPVIENLWNAVRRQNTSLWLVTWMPRLDPLNWQEQQLWQSAAFVSETIVANHRIVLFNQLPDPPYSTVNSNRWSFGQITLQSYATAITDEGVRLTLEWVSDTPPAEDLTWFVHLLDPTGAIYAHQDRSPQGGYAPTNKWLPGMPVTDRLFFPVRIPQVQQAQWTWRIGWVNPGDGRPLSVTDQDGSTSLNPYVLIPAAER